MSKDAPHKHKFVEPVEEKVLLRNHDGVGVGFDIIKSLKCECGEKVTLDLERNAR